ncbi:MAG: hypothetical protein KatS3mg076_0032 [Candidatus Binatia bacterium]|nr:MAG: hypothetical protein KatS3mg076_0032 [Candidatus Binatia bacterium]
MRDATALRPIPVLAAALAGIFVAAGARAANFFSEIELADAVVVGTVTDTRSVAQGRLFLYDVRADERLAGSGPEEMVLAEEKVFPSDVARLRKGARCVLALAGFRPPSLYREEVAGAHLFRSRAFRCEAVASTTAIVRAYLAAGRLAEEKRGAARVRVLVEALDLDSLALDAVQALEREPGLEKLLRGELLRSWEEVLRNPRKPLALRKALLRLTAERRIPVSLPLLRSLLGNAALAPLAAEALAARDEALDPETFARLWEEAGAEGRLSLLSVPGQRGPKERLGFLRTCAREDPSPAVRRRATELLAREGDEAGLAELLRRTDTVVAFTAAKALVERKTPPARRALRGALRDGPYEARVAAVFALREKGTREDLELLAKVVSESRDPELSRLLALAFGGEAHGE